MQFALVFQASAPARTEIAYAEVASFTVLSGMCEPMFNAEAQAARRSRSKPTARKNLFVRWAESRGARASRWVRTAAQASELPERSRLATRSWSASTTTSRIDRCEAPDPRDPTA